jgi:CubicO group peptidase (beta-lactamase class C family)
MVAIVAATGCDHRSAEGSAAEGSAADPSSVRVETTAVTATPSATEGEAPKPPSHCVSCFDVSSDDWLPRASAAEVGFDRAPLDHLLTRSEETATDALIVVADGRVVVEKRFGRPPKRIETRSVTKSVVALAIFALVADGRIRSLDVPLSTFFPEFAEGKKAAITLRHVLTHTTGLAHGKSDADALNAADDRLAFARALPVRRRAGIRFAYSNEATQLLAGVVETAAGQPLDVYADERVLERIGIHGAPWSRDHAGKVQSYYGLRLTARDLARIGLLLLGEGEWKGREVIPGTLIREATAPTKTSLSYGLLFWRRSDLVQRASVPHADALAPFAERVFRTEGEYFSALSKRLAPHLYSTLVGVHRAGHHLLRETRPVGFYAVGGLGQRLAVYPRARIVAVRQHRRRPGDDRRANAVSWRAFFDDVEALAPELARPTGD